MKTNPLDPSLSNLNACDCCAGAESETPAAIENRPGLPQIVFRAGAHAQFKASLLAALSDAERPQLGKLRTREPDDLTIALLDSFAAMADVLTFYSERIANEAYLRTATERRSVVELARAIGYELRPGAAGQTWLAFTVEEAPGAPGFALVPQRTKVQSVPGPEEKPQVYETIEDLFAHKDWNSLQPLSKAYVAPYHGMTTFRLKGTATQLKPGDAILIVGKERENDPGSERWDCRRVKSIHENPDPDPAKAFTEITVDHGLGSVLPWVDPTHLNSKVYALRLRTSVFGSNAPDWRIMPASLRKDYLGYEPAPSGVEWPDLTLANISNSPLPESVGAGLYGEFFNGTNFETRRFSRTDPTIDFEWNTGSPDARLAADTFSIRWTGWLRAPKSGIYTFETISDDGVRLIIDGAAVIDNWTDHGATSNKANVRLTAGQFYDIKLEFYENGGAAVIRLLWKLPNANASVVIPTANLFPRDIHTLHLDSVQKSVVTDSWLVVVSPQYAELYQVKTAVEDSRTAFTLSAKTTRLTVQGENLREKFNESVRAISIFAQSELLEWADLPLTTALAGFQITLDREVHGVPVGRTLLVRGRTVAGEEQTEVARIAQINATTSRQADESARPLTLLTLEHSLAFSYQPATVTIFANVAAATNGETVREILGHGDAAKPHQEFQLKQGPLTFTPALNANGSTSSLEVFVNDVKWTEVDSLYDRGPRERIFVARREDDGSTRLVFGDGKAGALLPTGAENISAVYRKGVGLAGNVKAGQLTLLMNRPLGIKSVTNLDPSSGAQEPEQLDDARQNAPLQTLTLGRIVSLQDYEDFARAFSGVAKAHATWVWTPRGRGVFVTILLPGGVVPPTTSAIAPNLSHALQNFGNPLIPVKVEVGSVRAITVQGEVRARADRIAEQVKAAVDSALVTRLNFTARRLGQNIAISEVIALIQNVPGVESVNLTKFDFKSAPTNTVQPMLAATRPLPGDSMDSAKPAEILVLAEDALPLLEVKPL